MKTTIQSQMKQFTIHKDQNFLARNVVDDLYCKTVNQVKQIGNFYDPVHKSKKINNLSDL